MRAAGKGRLIAEFACALFFSAWWYFIASTRYGTRDLELIRKAVAERLPGECTLWLAASLCWLDLGARMKSRPVLCGAVAICLFMAVETVGDLRLAFRW